MVKTDIRLNSSHQLVLRFNQQNFTGNKTKRWTTQRRRTLRKQCREDDDVFGFVNLDVTPTIINELRFSVWPRSRTRRGKQRRY
jgi:hypothetical protein